MKNKNLSLKEISSFNEKFRMGKPLQLEYVNNIVNGIIVDEESIKLQLNKLTVSQLRNMRVSTHYTDKKTLIDGIYADQLENIYHFLSGDDTITIAIDFKTTIREQILGLINKFFIALTQEKLDNLLVERKEKHEKIIRQRNEYLKKIKNPQTLDDYERAASVRKLSSIELITYDKLLADKELNSNYQSTSTGYSIRKTKDTRDNRDLWVVTFDEKSDNFKELNRQMKELGGTGYSRFTKGFNFYFDPKEKIEIKFGNLKSSERNINAALLKKSADSVETDLNILKDSNIPEDKKKEKIAELIYLKESIYKISNLIDRSEIKYFGNVSNTIHIKVFEEILKQYAQNNSSIYGCVNSVKYPLTYSSIEMLNNLLLQCKNVANTIMAQKKLYKLLKKASKASESDKAFTGKHIKEILSVYNKGLYAKKISKYEPCYKEILQYKILSDLEIKSGAHLRTALREYLEKVKGITEYEDADCENISSKNSIEINETSSEKIDDSNIDVFSLIKNGVSIEKYSTEFLKKYHNKIFEMLMQGNTKLKSIAEEYFVKEKKITKKSLNTLSVDDVSAIINSRDIDAEDSDTLVKSFKEVLEKDFKNYLKFEKCIGKFKKNMKDKIKMNVIKCGISKPVYYFKEYDRYIDSEDEAKAFIKALNFLSDLQLNLLKAGSIKRLRDIINYYKEIYEKNLNENNISTVTLWKDTFPYFKELFNEITDLSVKKIPQKNEREQLSFI